MAQMLKIVAWNINALFQHINEVKIFIFNNKVDIMWQISISISRLILETYLTEKYYFKILSYSIYHIQTAQHIMVSLFSLKIM
jgi:hypothetical protein